MSELCVFMLCKLYKDGKNLETSWGLQNEKKSMQTTDVRWYVISSHLQNTHVLVVNQAKMFFIIMFFFL